MRGLILAGGYGTRLGELGKNRSKVLLPVGGRPVIDYVMDRLMELDELEEVLVVTNDKFHPQFVEWSTSTPRARAVTVLNDGTTSPENRLGAVGDVLFGIEQTAIDEDLVVIAGDNLCDFPLARMAATLKDKGSCIAAYDIGRIEDAAKYGNPTLGDDMRVVNFVEKPARPENSLIAVAIYMFRRANLGLFRRFQLEGRDLDLIGGFIQWAYREAPIFACVYGAEHKWWDIGDPEIYRDADRFYGGSHA